MSCCEGKKSCMELMGLHRCIGNARGSGNGIEILGMFGTCWKRTKDEKGHDGQRLGMGTRNNELTKVGHA